VWTVIYHRGVRQDRVMRAKFQGVCKAFRRIRQRSRECYCCSCFFDADWPQHVTRQSAMVMQCGPCAREPTTMGVICTRCILQLQHRSAGARYCEYHCATCGDLILHVLPEDGKNSAQLEEYWTKWRRS